MLKDEKAKAECPSGREFRGRKRHYFVNVKTTRLPKGDKRGDYHSIEKCKHCGAMREYDFITVNVFSI